MHKQAFTSLAFWVQNLDPFIVRFSENVGIRWYGFAYFMGFIVAALLLSIYYKHGKSPLNPDQQTTLLTALIVGVLVGGRLGYMLLYDFNNLINNPLTLFKVWKGGMASHGGFLGVFLTTLWYCKRARNHLFTITDIVSTLTPAGLFFGRIANFINGYLWGKISYVPWAVIFPNSAPGTPVQFIGPRHPSQLYEALLEGLLLFIYTQYRFWKKRESTPKGKLSGEFLIGYAVLRFIVEFFREPDSTLILHLSRGQFYSIFIALGGLSFILIANKLNK